MYSPYRKQKFKSPFMNKMHEKYIRAKKTLRTWFRKFMEKGHERLTLMLIPHSEKKIFNFQISNFTISFFIIILLVIVTFSIVSINDHESSQTQISKLSNLSKNRQGQIMAFKKSTKFTIKNLTKFTLELKKLVKCIGVNSADAILPFYGQGGIDYTINPDMQKKYGKNFSFPEEIKELNNINKKVVNNTEHLKRVNSFLNNYKQVMNHTPSLWPVAGGGFITSPFGYRPSPFTGIPSLHTGVDIAWWPGSPIKSTAAGEIISVGFKGGYGLCILIKHKYGFSSLYAHLQTARVKAGDSIVKGQIIGAMGNTGRATGYHLHYEVRLGNTAINPEPYLTSKF